MKRKEYEKALKEIDETLGESEKEELSEKKPKILKKKKKHLVLKIVGVTIPLLIVTVLIVNRVRADLYNNKPPIKDPFAAEDVFDKNDKDIEIGSDGQIVSDKLSDSEKETCLKSLSSVLLRDANLISATPIEKISDVLAFSLLPYNLSSGEKENNKYCLSVLLKGDQNAYALNYLTGSDFESQKESSGNFFLDFVNFIDSKCALVSCMPMSENGAKIKSLLAGDTMFVGDAYKGYKESGDEFYFIPVYNKNGGSFLYNEWSASIDAYSEDPMEKLYGELEKNGELSFEKTPFIESANLERVSKIFSDLKTVSKSKTDETELTK